MTIAQPRRSLLKRQPAPITDLTRKHVISPNSVGLTTMKHTQRQSWRMTEKPAKSNQMSGSPLAPTAETPFPPFNAKIAAAAGHLTASHSLPILFVGRKWPSGRCDSKPHVIGRCELCNLGMNGKKDFDVDSHGYVDAHGYTAHLSLSYWKDHFAKSFDTAIANTKIRIAK